MPLQCSARAFNSSCVSVCIDRCGSRGVTRDRCVEGAVMALGLTGERLCLDDNERCNC